MEVVKRRGKWVKVETEAEKEKREAREAHHQRVMQGWRAEVERQVKEIEAEYRDAVPPMPVQDGAEYDAWLETVRVLEKARHAKVLVAYGYEAKGLLGPQRIETTEAMRVVRERIAAEDKVTEAAA